jgi:hypothetical protein
MGSRCSRGASWRTTNTLPSGPGLSSSRARSGSCSSASDRTTTVATARRVRCGRAGSRIDERGLSTRRDRAQLPAEQFLELCAELLEVPLAHLAARGKDAETTHLRYLAASVGIERWRQRQVDLARCLGRWPEAVGRWARRAGRLRVSDERFRAEYESLGERLSAKLGDGRPPRRTK